MKIYFYRIRIFLSNENIFLSNENNFYRMQIYFYRMKIIFIEFCYISATILHYHLGRGKVLYLYFRETGCAERDGVLSHFVVLDIKVRNL